MAWKDGLGGWRVVDVARGAWEVSMGGGGGVVCTRAGDKITVTGTTSWRYATITGTVSGGGTIKAYIRIR